MQEDIAENKIERNSEYTYTLCYEDKFFQEDLEDRRLYINNEIDKEAIDMIVYHIMRYNRLDNGTPINKRKPIRLYIISPGGVVSDGFGVIDAILLSKTPVYTINLAECSSMGFLIYIAGSKRYALPHCEFLMHDGATGVYDSTSKAKDRLEFDTIQIADMIKKYVLERTSISSKKYNQQRRIEWYFLPEEAKQNGVVDFIVGKDCDIDEIL